MDCSPPGSSVRGIFQVRILEWVAISFSRRSSRPRDRTCVSRVVDRRLTVWTTREMCGEINLGPEINMHTLLHLKCITNEDLLCSTGNSTQFFVITFMKKETEKRTNVCAVASALSDSLQPMDCSLPGSSVCGDSSGRNAGVHFHFLFQYEKRNNKKERMYGYV